jgi:hypothetical protein
MGLSDRVWTIVSFLRGGYPAGLPVHGYAPLLALLPRQVSDHEVTKITSRLISRTDWPIDTADVGVEITRITQEMPSLEDIERVQHRIAALGEPGAHPDKPPCGA